MLEAPDVVLLIIVEPELREYDCTEELLSREAPPLLVITPLVGTLDVVVVNVLGRVFIVVFDERLGDTAFVLSVLPELNELLTVPIPLV